MSTTNIAKSTLIFCGTAVLGTAYIPPVQKKFPGKEFVNSTYFRYGKSISGIVRASEERKKELFSDLRTVKENIRKKAQWVQIDPNTRMGWVTSEQKTNVYCTKLMNTIMKPVI